MKTTRNILTSFCILTLCMFALASCGGDDGDSEPIGGDTDQVGEDGNDETELDVSTANGDDDASEEAGDGDADISEDTETTEDSDLDTEEESTTGDGSWLDAASGLTWQNPPADTKMFKDGAQTYCDDLSLDGYDDWRLPTVGELRSLIRGCAETATGGTCNLDEGDCVSGDCRDDACNGCADNNGPADGCYWPADMEGICHFYWTQTGVGDSPTYGWSVMFMNGNVTNSYKFTNFNVRCVR